MPEPANLSRHLKQCFQRGLNPRLDAADAKLWLIALTNLIKQGALDEALFSACHLSSAFPQSVYIRNAAQLLKSMPPEDGDPAFSSFADQGERSVQVLRRSGATEVLFAFCGIHGALGLPLPIAHRWFGRLGMHVVYLRDSSSGFFENGIPMLGDDRVGAQRALTGIVDELQAKGIVCYGNSTGGFGALLYGVEMGARAVLGLNAVIKPPNRTASRLGSRAITSIPKLDLRALYTSARARPRARLVYAAENDDDRTSALAMAGVPSVTVEPIADCSAHDAHLKLIEMGRFGALLRGALLGGCNFGKEVEVG